VPPTIECSGHVRVALAPAAAVHYFTPEGERRWAPGWDPVYAAGLPAEPAPGLVFETGAHGARTTWVVTHCGPLEMAYSRFVPGEQAGTIAVRCEPDGDGTLAHVTYRLTALGSEGARRLAGFEEAYPRTMRRWEELIGRAVASG
jgi:hypothetical protein